MNYNLPDTTWSNSGFTLDTSEYRVYKRIYKGIRLLISPSFHSAHTSDNLTSWWVQAGPLHETVDLSTNVDTLMQLAEGIADRLLTPPNT